jgi:hypothetical protein
MTTEMIDRRLDELCPHLTMISVEPGRTCFHHLPGGLWMVMASEGGGEHHFVLTCRYPLGILPRNLAWSLTDDDDPPVIVACGRTDRRGHFQSDVLRRGRTYRLRYVTRIRSAEDIETLARVGDSAAYQLLLDSIADGTLTPEVRIMIQTALAAGPAARIGARRPGGTVRLRSFHLAAHGGLYRHEFHLEDGVLLLDGMIHQSLQGTIRLELRVLRGPDGYLLPFRLASASCGVAAEGIIGLYDSGDGTRCGEITLDAISPDVALVLNELPRLSLGSGAGVLADLLEEQQVERCRRLLRDSIDATEHPTGRRSIEAAIDGGQLDLI